MPPNPSQAEPQASPDPPHGGVALFIDWENFKYSLYEIGQQPDITLLMQAVQERYGRPAIARAYADWQDYYHRKSFDQMALYNAGVEPVYVPSRRSPTQHDRIKNSVDVKMSLDCLEVSYTSPHVRTFVLVAGDADFLHIAGLLRRRGGRVVMIGVSGSTSHHLRAAIDELIHYDADISQSDNPPAQTEVFSPTPPIPTRQPTSLEAAVEMVVALVREQRGLEDGRNYPPLLSWLGLQLRSRAPDFNAQKHGFPKFKDFVSDIERQGALSIETQGLTDRVWLPEDRPEPAQRRPAPAASDADLAALIGDLAPDEVDQMADVVLTADDIENSHREYMAKSLLVRFLHNKGHWDPAALPARAAPLRSPSWQSMDMDAIVRRIEVALDKGLLFSTLYPDPYTGGEKVALELNRSHPFVRRVLDMPETD